MGFRNPVTTAIDPTARSAAAAAQTAASNAQASATAANAAAANAQTAANAASQAANNITATQITSGAVTTPALAAGAVTAATIAAGAVQAAAIAAGAIDGQTITGATIRTAAAGRKVTISSAANDSIVWSTGDAQQVAAGALSVGLQTGSPNTHDAGYLVLQPPQIGVADPNPPYLYIFGQSRDGTLPGWLQLNGQVKIQNKSTVSDVMTFAVPPLVPPWQGGSGAWPTVPGKDYVDANSYEKARGLRQLGRGAASYGSITTTPVEFAIVRLSVALVANRIYQTAALLRIASTVANDSAGANIKLTRGTARAPLSTDTTIAAGVVVCTLANTNFTCAPDHWFTVTTSDTYQFSVWVTRTGGTGTVTATNGPMGDAHLSVVDHGAIDSVVAGSLNPNNINNYTL